MRTRAMQLSGRAVIAASISLVVAPMFAATFVFTALDIPQPRTINPDALVVLPDRKVFFLDAIFQQAGVLPLDGGAPTVVPLVAGPGERVDAEDVVVGPDAVYFIGQVRKQDGTERSVIGRIAFDLRGVQYFDIPTATACSALQDCNLVVAKDGGAVYFTETREGKVGRFDLTGTFTEYPIRVNNGIPNYLGGIAAAEDGNLYVTAPINNSVIRMTPAGATTVFRIGPGRSFVSPDAIVAHPNGNVYVTTDDKGIAELTPAGVVTEFDLPRSNGDPIDIAVGGDDALYIAQRSSRTISRFDPVTKERVEVAITNGETPTAIVSVPGATSTSPELVVNAYNSSFDLTPQKLTVDNTTTPPPKRPDLVSGVVPLAGASPLYEYREGSELGYSLVFQNIGAGPAAGTVIVSSEFSDAFDVRNLRWTGPPGKGSCTPSGGQVVCTTIATPEFQGGEVAEVTLVFARLVELDQKPSAKVVIAGRVDGGGETNTSNNASSVELLATFGRARFISPLSLLDSDGITVTGR